MKTHMQGHLIMDLCYRRWNQVVFLPQGRGPVLLAVFCLPFSKVRLLSIGGAHERGGKKLQVPQHSHLRRLQLVGILRQPIAVRVGMSLALEISKR